VEKHFPLAVFSFFSKKSRPKSFPFGTDIHSHLIPGIDDGVKTNDEAAAVIRKLTDLGFTKFITTPHINHAYKNTPAIILNGLANLREFLASSGMQVEIAAAAEYYLDDNVLDALEQKQPLLTFGKDHLLFETNFLSEPLFMKDFIFKAITQGYRPLLAHPERYAYFTLAKAEEYRSRGALLQVNLLSLSGFYSAPVQKMAEKLIDKGWVDFLGSDCHNMIHATELESVFSSRHFKKVLDLDLLNKRL
jgi:protein-tyrosine phosphatase